MKKAVYMCLIVFFCHGAVFAQSVGAMLAGTSEGLFSISGASAVPLWNEGEIKKIVPTNSGKSFFLLTTKGIFYADGDGSFYPRNNGLPVKTLKKFTDGEKSFVQEMQDIKDLKIHPRDDSILACATNDFVFLTRDGGASWKNLGLSARTTGVKSVALASAPDLTVFMSHPIYGVSYIQPDAPSARWIDIYGDFESMGQTKYPDEISDIVAVYEDGETSVYAAQTFRPCVYKLDWEAKRFRKIWRGRQAAYVIDSLNKTSGPLLFVSADGVRELKPASDGEFYAAPFAKSASWLSALARAPGDLNCALIPAEYSGAKGATALSELWILKKPNKPYSAYTAAASGKKALYIPTHQINDDQKFTRHIQTLRENNLNAVVVDMKDDYGNVRFSPQNPDVLKKGAARAVIDLDSFVARMKQENIYLIARIVVFKDKALSVYNGGEYGVYDKKNKSLWRGYYNKKQKIESEEGEEESAEPQYKIERVYYDEYWVDPYCEYVWEYNVQIAAELVERGFDEIQFDYIRFPTDGVNLDDASYRWRDEGMDKESALSSFLAYARESIKAPISIDIYGANGWYRSGARTGQDVELLSKYTDVICPMFYPSHFEQDFYAYEPANERPYRIYFYGCFRNAAIARNRVVIRPFAQAFYLNVAYDRKYYDDNYVRRQIFGIRDTTNSGYTYWNNIGRYDEVFPDPSKNEPYPQGAIPAEVNVGDANGAAPASEQAS